jgi:hypothetical protein
MPQVSSIYAFALLFAYANIQLGYLAVAVLFSSLIPLASLAYHVFVMKGDPDVERKERKGLFAVAIASYLIGVVALSYSAAPFIFTALMLSYLINTVVAALVTKYFTKVSIHVWGISGPSVAIFYDYGPVGLLFMLFLAGMVGAARIKLGKHTPKQVLLSFLLSVPITFIVIYAIAPMIT